MQIKQVKQIAIPTLWYVMITFTTFLCFETLLVEYSHLQTVLVAVRGVILFAAGLFWIIYLLSTTFNILFDYHDDSGESEP